MGRSAHIDTTAAEAYEKFLVPTLNQRVAAEAVKAAAPRPGERILDVACGTGIVMRIAAPLVAPGGGMTGVDVDPAMLAVGRSVLHAPDGVTTEWQCADVQRMNFESGAFDAAICVQGPQYFPDCSAGLAEIHRVMKPGGRLAVAIWSALEDCKGQLALARALARRNVDAAAIRKAYSFGSSERLLALASGTGFRDAAVAKLATTARFPSARDFVEAFASGSLSSRAAIARVPENQQEAFLEDVRRDLEQYGDANGLALPLGYLLMTARA